MMTTSKAEHLLELIRQAGILRPRDLDAYHIPRQYLRILCDQGRIQRIGRGLYSLDI